MKRDPAAQIIALVSGFPGEHAWKRQLLMMQAYIDASAKGDPRILVLAGYIAPADLWIEFSYEWKARLDHAGLKYFKMNEMSSRPEVAGHFYRVIEETGVPAAITVIIRTDEMRQVLRSLDWPRTIKDDVDLENPYYFGFKAVSNMLVQRQHELGIIEPIDLIFDEESEKIRTLIGWDLMKLSATPEQRALMGDANYKNDERVLPLQAADLLAWWIRKWELEGVSTDVPRLPFPWEMNKGIPRLHGYFGEKAFRYEFSEMLKPENLAKATRIAQIKDPKAALELKFPGKEIVMTIPDPSSPWNWGQK